MRRILNKKGIVVGNALSLVIAVIGVLLLVAAGVRLYNFFVNNETRNAQEFINGLEGKIELLEVDEGNVFLLPGLDEWSLVGWSKDVESRPEKCFFSSCLCSCPTIGNVREGLDTKLDSYEESCQNRGICREMDFDEIKINKIINYEDGGSLKFAEGGVVELRSLLLGFNITKKEDTLSIEGTVPATDFEEGQKRNLENGVSDEERDRFRDPVTDLPPAGF